MNLNEFTVDGKIYGLPRAGYVEGVFYNKKMFEDAGVQVPKTWLLSSRRSRSWMS
ncbi:extracellular solute-binding protein [Paenibacillus alginolyticus]|uniref:extracellular solute-binding protein n=1 Tax=Paenibacillus alginolyticus TaxID=59839 RepID=UPI00228470F2|nr:extracellular solute-binding protein [Paenibacillus alginolyticus]